MNKLLDLGREFLTEHIIGFGDYDMFDSLKNLNRDWFQQLHDPFFYQQNTAIQAPMINCLINGLYILHDMEKGHYIIPSSFSDNRPSIKYYKEYTSICYNKQRKHGPSLVFYDDFTLKSRTIYKNGVINGFHQVFDKDGRLIKEKHYKDGIIVDCNSSRICYKIFEYFKRWIHWHGD